jgi:hypothetical protein
VRPKPEPEPLIRFEIEPGEQAQVDFAEFQTLALAHQHGLASPPMRRAPKIKGERDDLSLITSPAVSSDFRPPEVSDFQPAMPGKDRRLS